MNETHGDISSMFTVSHWSKVICHHCYLQAASGTVLCHNADVGRVDAGPDEPGKVVKLDVSHLKITTQTHCNYEYLSFQTSHSQTPWKQRMGGERTDGSFMYKVWRITLPAFHQNSLFTAGELARCLFLRVETHSCSGHPVETCMCINCPLRLWMSQCVEEEKKRKGWGVERMYKQEYQNGAGGRCKTAPHVIYAPIAQLAGCTI